MTAIHPNNQLNTPTHWTTAGYQKKQSVRRPVVRQEAKIPSVDMHHSRANTIILFDSQKLYDVQFMEIQ
jgi:hypothetical protein